MSEKRFDSCRVGSIMIVRPDPPIMGTKEEILFLEDEMRHKNCPSSFYRAEYLPSLSFWSEGSFSCDGCYAIFTNEVIEEARAGNV
jgi:hypothetical protein